MFERKIAIQHARNGKTGQAIRQKDESIRDQDGNLGNRIFV